MTLLFLGSALFIVTHFVLASAPIRSVLVRSVGEDVFLGIFSLIAFISFGLLIYGYTVAGPSELLWQAGLPLFALAKFLVLVSILLLVMGLMSKSPIAVKTEVGSSENLAGVLKITRHPVQWAIFLWGFSHLIANGDSVSLVFFGTFVLVAGVGTLMLDKKYAAKTDPAWATFFSRTSNLPFLAIVSGKTRFGVNDLDWKALPIGFVLYTCLYVSHEWLSGIRIY